MEQKTTKSRARGWVFLALWAFLIILGIIEKRIYGHPELMVFFHLPAAVFLVLSWYELSFKVRKKYRESLAARASLFGTKRP
jgi:hypothetical protein